MMQSLYDSFQRIFVHEKSLKRSYGAYALINPVVARQKAGMPRFTYCQGSYHPEHHLYFSKILSRFPNEYFSKKDVIFFPQLCITTRRNGPRQRSAICRRLFKIQVSTKPSIALT